MTSKIPVSKGILHEKKWGSELYIVNKYGYCGKIMSVKQSFGCSLHYHKDKTETFYVLEGKLLYENINQTTGDIISSILEPGDIVHIYPGLIHRFWGLESVNRFIEFSTLHKDSDSLRVSPSGQSLSEEQILMAEERFKDNKIYDEETMIYVLGIQK